MTPETVKATLDKLRLSVAEAATLCGISRGQMYKHLLPVDHGDYREPADCTVRILRAYMAGYRPNDWPATARQVRKPIKES